MKLGQKSKLLRMTCLLCQLMKTRCAADGFNPAHFRPAYTRSRGSVEVYIPLDPCCTSESVYIFARSLQSLDATDADADNEASFRRLASLSPEYIDDNEVADRQYSSSPTLEHISDEVCH